ncbi:MAG: hypothetical protein WBP93_00100 [Pyrinomonadaceae bacterium]
MKKIVSNLLVYTLILLTVNSVSAQSKPSEERLKDASGEYSFTVPTGFRAQRSEEGFGLVNTAQTVLIVLKAHDFQTFENFAAQSNVENDGFTPIGKVQSVGEKGKAFRVFKKTPQGYLIVDTFVMFSPFGGGMLVVAFSDTANHEKSFQTALQIAQSVEFAKAQASEDGNPWQTFLRGKHLLYLYTASGFSERTDIYLCPSGAFYYSSDSSSLSNNGSGAVGSNSAGTWKVSTRGGAKLVLQFRNGTLREYTISRRQASNEIGLNDNRYFVQTSNECR